MDKLLHIIQGNVRDIEAVKKTLSSKHGQASIIISTFGGQASFQISTFSLKMDDPRTCTDGLKTILSGLKELDLVVKPQLIVLSSMGVLAERDFPILFYPICKWILSEVMDDKRYMEANLADESQRAGISSSVIVRAPALTDAEGRGVPAITAGTGRERPMGYSVARKDVAEYIFERLIKEESMPAGTARDVSIAYR